MNPNDFTWRQRGAIDFILNQRFSDCPVTDDLVNRNDWEEGWMQAYDNRVKLLMRASGSSRQAVLAYVSQVP